ncbi:MAG: hypothetical protein HYY16_15540 [Planctomycetes bacterium]|nr:hypothetical protein [Planctomycetota bacterium]
MSDIVVLAAMKARELRNRFRQVRQGSRFKVAVLAAFSVAFWASLYRLFYFGLRYLYMYARDYYFEDLMARMFDIFFFALTLMLIFSNAIISYTSYFKSKETAFLLAGPVRPESVFLYRFGESLAFSSWAFLFLATPLMAAYGALFRLGAAFYVGTGLFFVAYIFIPAAIGAMVAMVVTCYIPRSRKGLLWGFVATSLAVVMILVSKILSIRASTSMELRLVMDVFEDIGFSSNPILPSFWISRGIRLLRQEEVGGALFFLGLIGANALFLGGLAHWMSSGLMMKGWFVSQGLRSARRYAAGGVLDRVLGRSLFFMSRGVRLMVVKDLKSFVRDPVQWSQFLIFFGLLAIYFLNLRSFAYEDRDIFWKNLIAQMNLLATSLTLATFSSRFIFPQLSLEGRRFWVIGMVPMERDQILFGKLALSFLSSLAISETLIAISSVMLRTPMTLAVLHAVALFGICLGLSGLAVGLGALYPNFAEDNPSKIVSGFGGTLNLVLSLGFVLAVMAAQGVPCFLYFGRWALAPGQFQKWIVIGMASIAVLSLAACLIPMALGLRRIQRLEV